MGMDAVHVNILVSLSFYSSVTTMLNILTTEYPSLEVKQWTVIPEKRRAKVIGSGIYDNNFTVYLVNGFRHVFQTTLTVPKDMVVVVMSVFRPFCSQFQKPSQKWSALVEPAGSTLTSIIPLRERSLVTIPFVAVEKYNAWKAGGWRNITRQLVHKTGLSSHSIRIHRNQTLAGMFTVYVRIQDTTHSDWDVLKDILIRRVRQLCSF